MTMACETDTELVGRYWSSLQSADIDLQVRLARSLVGSDESPMSDAFYSALCVLLSHGQEGEVRPLVERALLDDFDTRAPRLLPLLGHCYQREFDIESAHLVFSTCARLGYLVDRNAWAVAAASEVSYALAEHVLRTGLARRVQDNDRVRFDGSRVLSRMLYEDHFNGVRASAGRGGPAPARRAEGRLPDFIIAGSAKCGTTYLYDLIGRSPSVWNRTPKEIHFFSTLYRFGRSFYEKFFEMCPDGLMCGEASPDYLEVCNSLRPGGRVDTAARIHEMCPTAKIIVALRDPARRAVSMYNQMTSNDVSRGPRPGHRGLRTLSFADIESYRGGRILTAGQYVDPLRRYAEVFGRENVLIVTFPELADTQVVARKVSGFLGIEAPSQEQLTSLTRNAGSHEPLSDTLYAELREYYRPSLDALEREFGIQL